MSKPVVSVLIPTYNRSWGLRRAVDSVLAQSFAEFELLILDDASTDDTEAFASSLNDSRIRYHRQPRNVGVARNWGSALQLATGEFVALLMDDDRYEPQFLERRVSALRAHPEALFAFSSYRTVDENERPKRTIVPRCPPATVLQGAELVRTALARECFVGATLYRSAALRSVWRAAEPSGCVVDYAANVRLALQPRAAAVFLGGVDFVMAEHAGQISRLKEDEVFAEVNAALTSVRSERILKWADQLVRCELASWHVVGGRKAASNGRQRVAIRRLFRAIRLRPTSRHGWTQLAKTLIGYQK